MDKKYWWCRKLLDDGTYYYIYVCRDFARQICFRMGYDINIDVEDVPKHIIDERDNRRYD